MGLLVKVLSQAPFMALLLSALTELKKKLEHPGYHTLGLQIASIWSLSQFKKKSERAL